MSGCVDCVWDRYRDEMEEWAAATAEAERRLKARQQQEQQQREGEAVSEEVGMTQASMEGVEQGKGMRMRMGVHEEVADRGGEMSMDEDGGGLDTTWAVGEKAKDKEFWDEELYKHVPVGIREFMKHEKRMREKHQKEKR
jgi:hypothetical protein